jgi:hypothetical protein
MRSLFQQSNRNTVLRVLASTLLMFGGVVCDIGSQDSLSYRGPVVILRMIAPQYPPLARSAGVEGRISMRVYTASDGRVLRVERLEAEVYGVSQGSKMTLAPKASDLLSADIEKLLKDEWRLTTADGHAAATQGSGIWVEFVFTLHQARTPAESCDAATMMVECGSGLRISLHGVRPWPTAN